MNQIDYRHITQFILMGGPYNGCTIDGHLPPPVLIFQSDDGDVAYQLLVVDGIVLPVYELNTDL